MINWAVLKDYCMFNSTNDWRVYLHNLGVDSRIINQLSIRDIPKMNLYWNSTGNYIEPKVRYLFIPFWLQLFYSHSKIHLNTILGNESLVLLEQILHLTELEERDLISFMECSKKCSEIPMIKSNLIKNPSVKNTIEKLIDVFPEYKSLRRGNFIFYYFALFYTDQEIEKLKITIKLLTDLLVCGCMLDDLFDAKDDAENNEDNIINELGGKVESLGIAKSIFDESKSRISQYLPKLQNELDTLFYRCTFKFIRNEYAAIK